MNQPAQPTISTLATLRALVPHRPLYFNEARRITELQANRFRELQAIDSAELPEDAITKLPRIRTIEVFHLPTSGVSQWTDGGWVIAVDAGEPWQRQRFSQAHELWHIINYRADDWLCAGGSYQSPSVRREQLADYFAGCLLMPKRHVKRLVGQGFGTNDLADTFGVSPRAIEVRLMQLRLNEAKSRCAGPPRGTAFSRRHGDVAA
jgi:Zn-dependent peptidase ImmA (M78 family)